MVPPMSPLNAALVASVCASTSTAATAAVANAPPATLAATSSAKPTRAVRRKSGGCLKDKKLGERRRSTKRTTVAVCSLETAGDQIGDRLRNESRPSRLVGGRRHIVAAAEGASPANTLYESSSERARFSLRRRSRFAAHRAREQFQSKSLSEHVVARGARRVDRPLGAARSSESRLQPAAAAAVVAAAN